MILCQDKTTVRGDILIDDKPHITGMHPPTWQQCVFGAPYNKSRTDLPRFDHWANWEPSVMRILESSGMKHVKSSGSSLSLSSDSDSDSPPRYGVNGLKDFSEELKAMGI